MNHRMHPESLRRWIVSTGVASCLVAISGCSQPSLLITPVSARRDMVEFEVYRDVAFARDKVALIDLSGVIMNSSGWQLFGEGDNPVSRFQEQLDRARRDSAVKAVILRVNSPGGTVVASELMHAELLHFRKSTDKPVIALFMDVAASGGYYVACACDEIVAQPSTVTGSIGVIMQMFDVSGTMKMIGVQGDAITSGAFKDAGSPFRPMRPEERAHFQTLVDSMYEKFVKVVAAGRPNLKEEDVRRLADGRVWTADQAVAIGLVDRVAGMRETIEHVKLRVGSRGVRVVRYDRPLAFRPNYYSRTDAPGGGDVNLINIDMPALMDAGTPRFMYLWRP